MGVCAQPGAELDVAGDLLGGELGCTGLDLAAEDLSVADTEDVCLGLFAVVGAEPYVDAGKEVGLLSLPLERGDGEQVRQYSLVAEQVEVATEPVVDSQRRAGLVFCGAGAARTGRSRRSLSERDETGKPAGAAANAQAALGPADRAQSLQGSGRLRYCGIALQLVSASVSPFRSPAPVSSDLGQLIVHGPVLAELAQFPH